MVDTWKAQLLSKGERLVLIKNSLDSILNHYLSLFTVPTLITTKIGMCFRNFLWMILVDSRRYYLLDWKLVCRPNKKRCLWIRRIKFHNRSFLGKWLWCFGDKGIVYGGEM